MGISLSRRGKRWCVRRPFFFDQEISSSTKTSRESSVNIPSDQVQVTLTRAVHCPEKLRLRRYRMQNVARDEIGNLNAISSFSSFFFNYTLRETNETILRVVAPRSINQSSRASSSGGWEPPRFYAQLYNLFLLSTGLRYRKERIYSNSPVFYIRVPRFHCQVVIPLPILLTGGNFFP